ncbi:MAG: SH3 domain-containing protein, partial [Flavobacteriaceae bacterium]|nr:SH3 domain-containing protein [Flavobacteriaceae bacterium]
KTLMENNTSAIVFEPRVLVLTEPKQEAPVIFELHEGTKVQVLGNFQEFTEVRLANGQTGWMKDRELRKIKLSY